MNAAPQPEMVPVETANHLLDQVEGVISRIFTLASHDDLWVKRDHVLMEAYEHLWRGLATDPAIHIRLPGEPVFLPPLRDRVPHEHHARAAQPAPPPEPAFV